MKREFNTTGARLCWKVRTPVLAAVLALGATSASALEITVPGVASVSVGHGSIAEVDVLDSTANVTVGGSNGTVDVSVGGGGGNGGGGNGGGGNGGGGGGNGGNGGGGNGGGGNGGNGGGTPGDGLRSASSSSLGGGCTGQSEMAGYSVLDKDGMFLGRLSDADTGGGNSLAKVWFMTDDNRCVAVSGGQIKLMGASVRLSISAAELG